MNLLKNQSILILNLLLNLPSLLIWRSSSCRNFWRRFWRWINDFHNQKIAVSSQEEQNIIWKKQWLQRIKLQRKERLLEGMFQLQESWSLHCWLFRGAKGEFKENKLSEEQLQKQVQEESHKNMGWTWQMKKTLKNMKNKPI